MVRYPKTYSKPSPGFCASSTFNRSTWVSPSLSLVSYKAVLLFACSLMHQQTFKTYCEAVVLVDLHPVHHINQAWHPRPFPTWTTSMCQIFPTRPHRKRAVNLPSVLICSLFGNYDIKVCKLLSLDITCTTPLSILASLHIFAFCSCLDEGAILQVAHPVICMTNLSYLWSALGSQSHTRD